MTEAYGYRLFQYEGDDAGFRSRVRASSSCILDEVNEAGSDRAFVFVDEVQKEPEIFDAIKLANDKEK